MLYEQITPPLSLSSLVKCYWVIEDDNEEIVQQKIIPDGFTEIIFHYRDPYRINISGKWEIQSNALLAGQIKNHFFLENTGASGMIGIKFRPHALSELFFLEMADYTDRVVDLNSVLSEEFSSVSSIMTKNIPYPDKIQVLNDFFENLTASITPSQKIKEAIDLIFETSAGISVSELAKKIHISERQLERLFKRYVGLTPKFFCRIVRFSAIFNHVQQQDFAWSDIAHLTGFYDQSHFIKNFQEFTGEDPGSYFFEEENMANFFLKQPN